VLKCAAMTGLCSPAQPCPERRPLRGPRPHVPGPNVAQVRAPLLALMATCLMNHTYLQEKREALPDPHLT
jgi:hypothetical protein